MFECRCGAVLLIRNRMKFLLSNVTDVI